MMPKFFLNYGGPPPEWFENDPGKIEELKQHCTTYYKWPLNNSTYNIKGIDVTLYTYGVHRALELEIPDNAPIDTIILFNQAQKTAHDFTVDNFNSYNLLNNNCVKSVGVTLQRLDPQFSLENTCYPWNLDKKFHHYFTAFRDNTTKEFLQKFNENPTNSFAFYKNKIWADKKLTSVDDIISQAYQISKVTREKTKTTLLELEWVQENADGILHPTSKAPEDFRIGLNKFNQELQNIQDLKNLYIQEAPLLYRISTIFNNNPNFEIVMARITKDASKNPTGTSAKVLEKFHRKSHTREIWDIEEKTQDSDDDFNESRPSSFAP